jgi:hypothetical protein
VLGGPEVVRCVFHSCSTQTSMDLETCWSYIVPDVAVETEVQSRNFLVKRGNTDGEIRSSLRRAIFRPAERGTGAQLKALAPRSLGGARVPSIAVEGTGT